MLNFWCACSADFILWWLVNREEMASFKRAFDRDEAWKLLQEKATRVDDCLVMKKTDTMGYGKTDLGGVTMGSHRVSYILNKNDCKPIPAKDEDGKTLVVRHLCHKQRACIEPSHLELGTLSQNSYEDKIASGTLPRGDKNPNSKITKTVALEIKHSHRPRNHADYMTQKSRAEKFGVNRSTVSAIDSNETWAYLPDRHGVVKSTAERRRKRARKKRLVKTKIWSQQDFRDAAKYIEARIFESEDGKGGEFPPGPCYHWIQCKNPKGYGKSTFKSRPMFSHVLSKVSEQKRFPKPDEVVRHLCANTGCCRPSHLRFGTRFDNAVDALLHGSSKQLKLNAENVRTIRDSNDSNMMLAKTFGVDRCSIARVRSGKAWASVL